MGGVAGVCLQVSCFVSCSLTAALLAVCLPLGSGAVCNYLESCQLCRLQRPKVNIIGPITKLITFSVATVCGASLAGPPIQEGIGAPPRSNFAAAVLPAVSSRWCIAAPLLPSVSSRWHPRPATSSRWLFAAAPQPATTSPRRPCQQQTSSGGEKYFGLASNLVHLGRIC